MPDFNFYARSGICKKTPLLPRRGWWFDGCQNRLGRSSRALATKPLPLLRCSLPMAQTFSGFPAYMRCMKLRAIYIIFFLLLPILGLAQEMDNGASYKSMDFDRYFRFSYDNDFFTKTDEYYTQGINIELVSPTLRYNPLSKLSDTPCLGP